MQTLEEQRRAIQQKGIDKIPQNITLEQAIKRDDLNSVLKALPSYKDNSLQRFAKGAITGLQTLNDVAPAVEIYGRQIDMAIGGYFGAKPKTIERKALNLSTAYRNLQAAQKERYKYSNPEDTNSLAYGLGQGAVNYGMMLLGSGATASAKVAIGLAANALLENVEQQSERMPLNKNNEIDINQITPQWAKNSAIGTTTYLGISTILEKGFGFGKQVKMWETPIKTSNKAIKISSPVVKQAVKNALSEGVTEGLQSLTSTGILLAERKIDVSQLPDRLKDAWKEAVIGGIIGGTVGTAVGINQAHTVKQGLTEMVQPVLQDPELTEKVVEAIYDSGTAEMTNFISRELELSSELNAKHGAIYDTMQGVIYDAINNAGAFEGVPEAEIAQYVSDTSKMFANQVVAEAHKRGVSIDGVLKASDIKFVDGKIYMQAGKDIIAETSVTQENPEALKGSIEMNVNEQREETITPEDKNIKTKLEAQIEKNKKNAKNPSFYNGFNVVVENGIVRVEKNGIVSKSGFQYDEGATTENTGKNWNLDAIGNLIRKWNNENPVKMDENGQTKLFQPMTRSSFTEFKDFFNNVINNKNSGKKEQFNYLTKDGLNLRIVHDTILHDVKEKHKLQANDWEDFLNNIDNVEIAENSKHKARYNGKPVLLKVKSGDKVYGAVIEIFKKNNPIITTAFYDDEAGIDNWIKNEAVSSGTKTTFSNISLNDIITNIAPNFKTKVIKNGKNNTKLYQETEYNEAKKNLVADKYKDQVKFYNGEWINRRLLEEKGIDFDKIEIGDYINFFEESKKPQRAEHNSQIDKIAKNYFGTTDNINETGYILQDGSKLDFSDKKDGGTAGRRNYDHREIVDAFLDNPENTDGLEIGFNEFIDNGAIRLMPESKSMLIARMPSEQQIETLKNIINKYNGEIYLELTNDMSEWGSDKNFRKNYEKFSNPTKIIDDIRTYFNGGKISEFKKYFQLKNTPKQNKVRRGAFTPAIKAIELFKDANYSTLPHELAHFWLDNMWGYYRSGKASEAYTNNFKGVLDWLEVKDGQINLTRNQQEKFARGYEKYLLNGYAPNGLIQGAFDDYDKWLQKVYNDARELKVKLTPDAIQFFDTMTTGELPEYDVPETQAQIREQNIEQMNKDIETARKFVVEKQAEYNNFDGGNVITKDTVPVTTEGEKKQSKAYTNQASILGIAEQLNYNKADIAEQNKLASEYVKNNLDEARQIVNGEKEAPKNILKNAIYNAYLKEMLAIGDNEAYVNALKNQSLELTRAGQEIASQRGAIENIFDSGYWIRRIENLKKSKLAAQKFGNGWTASEQEQALSKMNDYIKNKVEAVMSEFMDATAEEQKKIAEKLSKEIAAEFKVKPDTKLYQSMYEPSEVRTRTNAYNYIYKYINGALGLDLTKTQYNEIIAKTMAIQKSIETTRNRNGNPSALFFKNISEMENYANSIEPSPALAILTSTVGRGNMLFSPKTIALNIESNIVNFFTEAITRRIQSGAINMAVDPAAIKDYLAYSREVFNTSGYQVSSMPSLDPTTQILSEKMTTTAGDRAVDKLGRFFEQTIFKYGLGLPDLFFKDMTFVDTANVLATKEAKGDTKKATELFKDICLIEPKTAKGKELREIAINEALVATYQNTGQTSDIALGIRNSINKLRPAGLDLNLGDLLSPFVKTPANVIGLGFDYTMGGISALFNIQTIYNDIQQGIFTETTRKSLRSLARNGIGFVAAAMISSLIDDDDYIPEYALLSPRERELVKMKGGVFNSVKIGDKYISLDYFGPLAMPLTAILNSKRGYDTKNKIGGYLLGAGYQALKLPVVGDLKDLLEGTGRTLTKDMDSVIKMAVDAAIDFVSSRSIPAIVTDVAKMTDEYERETNNNAINRLKSKIPGLREELPMQYNYGTGQPRETQNPVSQLFAGARIKEEVSSPVISEIDKLVKSGQQVTLSKITKPPASLATLPDEIKPKVEKEFAKLYAKNVNELIKMPGYKNLDDEEKTNNINGIRSLIVSDLKEKYGLNKKEKKPRTKKLINKKNINLN